MITIKPGLFLHYGNRIISIFSVLFVLSIIVSAYLILQAPLDYQMLDSVRIMYIHVPSAWLSLNLYFSMGILGFSYIVWRNPLLIHISEAMAQIGCGYALITLITGSIWGRPMWGTYWVWDPRLTSTLILLFFYIGYMLYIYENKPSDKTYFYASVIAIIGSVNVPIVKLSVEMWNTLHQPSSIIRSGGVAIAKSMLIPLISVFFSCISFTIFITFMKVKTRLVQIKAGREKQIKYS
ncbi:MAG: cytochrome c biogenesis protein CcsA [Alphaproteobacteria bacterium]|nr:cytochrome c biogenesis protein CcsA [Alphaproteobacteria bacterium]OJV13179.1 MAG: hypothetical protein BGO27_00035 [Alphaproteobacteria bacterium 33-17]